MNAPALPQPTPVTRAPLIERRREAPADAMGQLFWVVLAFIFAGLPHYLFVKPWVPALALCMIGWRCVIGWKRGHLPSNWVRVPLTILGFLAVLTSYRQLSGLDAGSALLIVMVSMKLLETRGHRDRTVVVLMCYFLLFAAFLREQAVWSAVYLFAGVLITTAALLQISRRGRVIPARQALITAGTTVAQAVPLMILLFVLFPRVPGPFWTLPQRGSSGLTGLSDEMSPGDITRLARSDKVAFRVTFDGRPPKAADLYWRGPVMNSFDGRTWRNFEATPYRTQAVRQEGPELSYRMTLEPHHQRWLLALESPWQWDLEKALVTSAGQLLSMTPVDRRVAYLGRSVLTRTIRAPETNRSLSAARRLPEATNPRSVAFARRMREQSGSDRDYLNELLQMIRTEPFYYTLNPPALGTASVDEFWFESRQGFCGHYASAFTFLARAAGIPARIVTGYQGGELNPLGDYWIVRQSDAHAWTEIWLEDKWVRFDPTQAVAPERIDSDLSEPAGSDTVVRGGVPVWGYRWGKQLVLSWDAANAAWNNWVLAYGPDRQLALMSSAGIQRPSSGYLVATLVVTVTVFLVGFTLIQQYRERPRVSRLQRGYDQLCAKLARVTRPRQPAEGPVEYATAIAALRPDLSEPVLALFGWYARLRYDGESGAETTREFLDRVGAFQPKQRPRESGDVTRRHTR
jgi:transglutaminase-like putative cysteine protease